MANAERLKDDHLTCSICYRPFNEPKTLQCLHTFCQECLQHHVQHTSNPRGIPCPVCRHVTVPDDPLKPRKLWAKGVKTDFKLAGILEALQQMEIDGNLHKAGIVISGMQAVQSDRKSQLNTILQVLKPAVNFIQQKIDAENDKIVKLASSRDDVAEEVKSCVADLVVIMKEKEGKLLDDIKRVYDCGKLSCVDNIKQFQDLVTETNDTIGLIDRLLSPGSEYATMECMPSIQKQQESVMKFVADPPTDIGMSGDIRFKSTVKSFRSILRSLELGSIDSGETQEALTKLTLAAMEKTSICGNSKEVDRHHWNGGGLDEDFTPLTEGSAIESLGLDSLPHSDQAAHPQTNTCYTSPLARPHQSPTTPLIPHGFFTEYPSRQTESQEVTTDGPPYGLRNKIETKCIEDNYTPSLKNVIVIEGSSGTVVIVLDYDNASLKAFREEHGQTYADTHRFSGYPQSMSKLGSDRVIVSLMNYKFVVFSQDLKQLSSIESDKWYSCMTTFTTQEKILGFVTMATTSILGGRHSTLDHLSLKGKSSTKYFHSASIQDLFSEISQVCTLPGNRVAVSDSIKREVICLSLEGALLWRAFNDQKEEALTPGSLACDSKGDIFMIDANRVLKLSGNDGRVLGEVITASASLHDPMAIAMDSRDFVYVTQKDGNVLVFIPR